MVLRRTDEGVLKNMLSNVENPVVLSLFELLATDERYIKRMCYNVTLCNFISRSILLFT